MNEYSDKASVQVALAMSGQIEFMRHRIVIQSSHAERNRAAATATFVVFFFFFDFDGIILLICFLSSSF